MESFRTSSLPCPPVNASIPRVKKAQTSPSMSHTLPGGEVSGVEAQAKTQSQRNAPKTSSPVPQRFITCHLVALFFQITHLSLPQFIWMPACCVTESLHQKRPSRTLLQLKNISSSALVLAPDTTVPRGEATGNPSQPCSKQKQVFLFCMRTGSPVQQASQIGRAISVL